MQLKKTEQTLQDQMQDRVFAAMETGNAGQARTLLREYREIDEAGAQEIRTAVIDSFGYAI